MSFRTFAPTARDPHPLLHDGWKAWAIGAALAALGLLFVWRNVTLAGGLILSAAARATYRSNGSFGGENDLVRVARDHLGTSLEVAALPLLLLAVATLVVAWWLGATWRNAKEAAKR